ncbi:MAG: hypothetical protein ACJAY3_001363 [Neolewinella sp.]|jgi:hypothetical protein
MSALRKKGYLCNNKVQRKPTKTQQSKSFTTFTIELVIDNPSSEVTLNQCKKPLILHFVAKVRHQ